MKFKTKQMNLILPQVICIIFAVLFISCNTLPKSISQEEYNSVRDYISIDIAGMPYLELCEILRNQSSPQYYSDESLPYYRVPHGSDFSKYSEYVMKISNVMNQLMSGYKLTDQTDNFYSWAIRNYRDM
jgi:hypothetical protein